MFASHPRIIMTFLFLLFLSLMPPTIPARAEENSGQYHQYLPLIKAPAPPQIFGIDFSIYGGEAEFRYGIEALPKWARAGDVLWSKVEPVRGGGYDWSSQTLVDANIRRLRAAGIEPMMIIQQTPEWAQQVPGRRCSPPKPEYIDDLTRFVEATIQRYSQGDLEVRYWEFWNEPDFAAAGTRDDQGIGCWGDPAKPDNGGGYYGEVLRRVYPVIKAANPHAVVFGGSLASFTVGDSRNTKFLRGMLTTAPNSFDALSFHAYGEYSYADILRIKTVRYRGILAEFGISKRPLVATEVAATCLTEEISSCQPNYDAWILRQANYAARIYAQASALELMGAFWFTFSSPNPGYSFSHLVDNRDGEIVPRPAYYAFRNSARLLADARYVGPPLGEPSPADQEDVQTLVFRKPASTLYVMWVPTIDYPKTVTALNVPVGAIVACTQKLELPNLNTYDCSDADEDGVIYVVINSLPQYVEVFD